jgi:hypothetical protein
MKKSHFSSPSSAYLAPNFDDIVEARELYLKFINSTNIGAYNFSLTTASESTSYARCFAIFGYGLILSDEIIINSIPLARLIRFDLDRLRNSLVESGTILRFNKPYLQLLSFSLSALSILKRIDDDPLIDHVAPLINEHYLDDLFSKNVFNSFPQTGNYAMFVAILILHISKYGNQKIELSQWEESHLKYMNQFGFWGRGSMSHSQFQNGYHQYEIFEYLNTKSVPWEISADSVAGLADFAGHFAPYIGGGGCYDYDAIFLLTTNQKSIKKHSELLKKTFQTLISEQNNDGGFCESKKIRPVSLSYIGESTKHVLSGKGMARLERFHQMLTLLRPKHNRIHTHWSKYSREWSESNLWDSWFRMLTIARIDVAFNPENAKHWGFINYPGIGFHPSLRG